MALFNPTFFIGILVLLYLSSFVIFAIIRIITGVSIQRIGYFSIRRLAYTLRDGVKIEVRGLGLNVHRPTFAQPTWLSVVVDELMITLDITEMEGGKTNASSEEDSEEEEEAKSTNGAPKKAPEKLSKIPSIRRDEGRPSGRSKTWEKLNNIKEQVKRLHRVVNWLRMVDLVATNSSINVVDVGNLQVGSFTIAVDTRRKMVDRARFFLQGRSDRKGQRQQAEWIITIRSVLFTADGRDSTEILDTASLNIHGFLYEALDGLRDTAVALKLGRVHIPYDDVRHSTMRYKEIRSKVDRTFSESQPVDVIVDQVMQELDAPGSTTYELMQTVSDSKDLISSALRGVKEVQFAVSFVGLTKRVEAVKTKGSPVLLTASMKEVGIDLHRLDPKSPAHRMYFPSKDIAHEALAAALSISIGLDDGNGKPERIMYIPMATTTVRTTLPSKTVELADEGTAQDRNANILFANSVVTSPSVDLDPRHLPLLLAMLRPKPKPKMQSQPQQRHMLISRLLPKANIKFSMHEPVLRITLPPVQKTLDPDEFDLIISNISSVSLDLESFHSTVEDFHYSLAATMRVQTHNLYYQTCSGNRFDLLETDSFDLKLQLNATPDVHVVATGDLRTFSVKMVREEIGDGIRHIIRQLRLDVEPDKMAASKSPKKSNFLRAMPDWLWHFQLQCSDFSVEVAGMDEGISEDTKGVAIQLDSWSAEYRAQRLEPALQRRQTSRRRASSRGMMSPPDSDILKTVPVSPRKRYHHDGDGRRVAIHVRGLEAFMVESAEKWEIEPFVNIPRFEIAFSTLSDNQGPVFHVHSHVRTLLVQYSLHRHYAVAAAALILRKSFMGTSRDVPRPSTPPTATQRQVVGHLSPPGPATPSISFSDANTSKVFDELVVVDVKATLIQIKAEMPSDPPLMLHIYGMEAGRHRWSPPFFHSKLIRLYAEAPRMRRVWARVLSIKNGRVDYRESRRKTSSGNFHEERMADIITDTVRLSVPHEMVIHQIFDNIVNTAKAVEQLHHRFKTGTNEYILDKGPEEPKNVPKVSLRSRTVLFELEDGALEWKLGMIYRAGRVEQMQRQAREEAFRLKVKKLHEEESRRGSSKLRTRSAAARGRSQGSPKFHVRSHSNDSHPRSSTEGYRRRTPRYDPEGAQLGISANAQISVAEAMQKLHIHNAQSWKQRIDRHYLMAKNGMKDLHSLFWGADEMIVADDLDDSENILEIPQRPALMSALINDLHFIIDKPSFPMSELPDYLHKVGKGMPRDMKYSLLVPMNVQINMGEARILLRDYPLPFIHVPAIKPGQSSRLPALSMKTDFVIAEEFRGVESSRKVRVQIVPPRNPEIEGSKEGCFAIDVRRTTSPVKSFSDMTVEIHSANPTKITWGPSYQPAIQDMMMAIESFTKPQLDPSDRVGFWDKIRLNFHSRVRMAWRGDGDVHLALKGSRDPYQVTGNGAGFLMCWRNDVRWNIHTEDDPTRFMTVSSGEYVIAVPDYSHQVREARRGQGEADSITNDSGHKSAAAFKKVVMKLSGKVEVLAGLVFERAIENGKRSFEFRPHYDVVLKSPQYAAPDKDGLPYDAFRGFRSQHIHLSVAVRAPADRSWSASNPEPSRSYNTVHLTPRFFTHFFAWWSLFGGPLSLPIRQGVLWPGREKNSKKFGRHLATIKYNLLFAPLFLSHIYKHKDLEDPSENAVSATGIKVRFDSFMLDLHQRREEFNTRDRGRGTQSRTSGMKIHAGQLDLVSADIRAVSASIKNATADSLKNKSISTYVAEQEDDGHDLSRFTIPDNDLSWIDMDDFVELDWILPTEPNPNTKILPLAYAPRITYFRQTDIGGVIEGDPDRTSPFGQEPTHSCIMSQDDIPDPRRVQSELVRRRLEQLDQQMETHKRTLGEIELQRIRGDDVDRDLRVEFEALARHTVVLGDKKTFLEGMLKEMLSRGSAIGEDSESTEVNGSGDSTTVEDNTVQPEEFASDFKNRFVVHNMQLKWNNTLRNVILRYIHQIGQRKGFVYYLSRPAIKFILDIVEEQARSKTTKNGTAATPGDASESSKTDREMDKEIEDRIRKILQDGRKFASSEDAGPQSTTMADLTSGIAEEFTPQNSYHVRVIAPQIQLQSDKNKKHVVLITAKGMELKVVEVLDKDRLSDNVSGLVQRRFLVNMDSTQFFVTHQKWFSTQLVSMYSGSTYGSPSGSAWPPWVPMEVMVDFQADPFGFKRVVQKTSAMLRYDKYNTLRLKYNDEVNTQSEGQYSTSGSDKTESRMDNLWVEFPQARALCNSSQYYAIYVIVLDLLMYSEPAEKTRNERLEKIMLASDFSDLRGAPEAVLRLQERVRQLEDIKTHFQIHSKYLDKKGWKDRLNLERDLAACEDELFFMMKAITTSQRKFDSSASSALLKWSISVKEIVWQLIRDNNEPLVELQLKDVEYDRTDNADGSHINLIQVGKILGLNLLPDAIYPAMIAPYVEGDRIGFDTGSQPMIRVYWYMLEAIAGIPVMDHFEVNLFPLKIQLEREVGNKLFEYIFPGIDGDKPTTGRNDSPFMIKQSLPGDDEDAEEDESMSGSIDRLGSAHGEKDSSLHFSTRAGSLELRLRPTLTSEPTLIPNKQKAVSIHSGDGHSFRLFRSGTGSKTLVTKKPSHESLRGNPPRPGIIPRSSTGLSSKDALSSNSDVRKGSRFALRTKSHTEEAKAKKSDDLTKMMTRASNYMTFAYIKMPSVVLCLSYKGKGERNFSDVHDFVFKLPTIEYRNKTWSNLDLALALKSRVIKALISHTGAIIGNKFSRHRPNTAQQSKLRELATSSVLLSTPQLSDSRDNSGDDSSSLYGTSPVDFSRSPPRSVARSQTSIPVPSSRSSSITSTRSQRSSHVVVNNQGGGAVPASFMIPPPHDRTPTDKTEVPSGHRSAFGGLLRPSSSGGSRLFGGYANHEAKFGGVSRPSTSAGLSLGGSTTIVDFEADEVVHERKKSAVSSIGGGGFFREKLSALTNRRKDKERDNHRENPSISITHRSEEENSASEDEGAAEDREGGDVSSLTGSSKLSSKLAGWSYKSRGG